MLSPFLLSVNYRYRGEHKDLYTVAVHNIFGAYGLMSNGEYASDPEIRILETDDYGRTLFFYSEYFAQYPSDYGMAFVIMQTSGDGWVYYYPDRCCLPWFGTTDDEETVSAQLQTEALEELKAANDWNREINMQRCAKAEITRKKPDGKWKPTGDSLDPLLYPCAVRNGYIGTDLGIFDNARFCERDRYGRELYYIRGTTKDPGPEGKNLYTYWEFAVILDTDGTCPKNAVAYIKTPDSSPEAICKLKQEANWNEPC